MDVAVRPTGQRWVVSYDESGVGELVAQLEDLDPALVLLEASGGLELPLVAALAAAALPVVVVNPRQTHSDRLVENEAQGRSVPGVQREMRSTPTARLVSSGRRAYHSNRRTWAANEGLIAPYIGPSCLRRATSHPQRQQFPRGRPSGELVDPPGLTRAHGSRPQVSMVGNLGESQTVQPLLPGPTPR